jgi:hypothetical protein
MLVRRQPQTRDRYIFRCFDGTVFVATLGRVNPATANVCNVIARNRNGDTVLVGDVSYSTATKQYLGCAVRSERMPEGVRLAVGGGPDIEAVVASVLEEYARHGIDRGES